MSKGSRHRRERKEAAERAAAEARAAAEEKARKEAFFATWSPEDDAEGPAFPCPECGSFDRRWAEEEVRLAAIEAYDREWGLVAPTSDDRRVALCRACGAASVLG